jgi:hypothetical protein
MGSVRSKATTALWASFGGVHTLLLTMGCIRTLYCLPWDAYARSTAYHAMRHVVIAKTTEIFSFCSKVEFNVILPDGGRIYCYTSGSICSNMIGGIWL